MTIHDHDPLLLSAGIETELPPAASDGTVYPEGTEPHPTGPVQDYVDLTEDDLQFDPTAGEKAPVEESDASLLAKLREGLRQTDVIPRERLVVPLRPGVSVLFRCDADDDEVSKNAEKATPRAANGRPGGEPIAWLAAALLLVEKCEGIYYEDRLMNDEDGQPLTFRSKWIWEDTQATSNASACRKFFGLVGDLLMTSVRVLETSGFDEKRIRNALGPTR